MSKVNVSIPSSSGRAFGQDSTPRTRHEPSLNPFFVRASVRTAFNRDTQRFAMVSIPSSSGRAFGQTGVDNKRIINELRYAMCGRIVFRRASLRVRPFVCWVVKEHWSPREVDAAGEQASTIDHWRRADQHRVRSDVVAARVDDCDQRAQPRHDLAPCGLGAEHGMLERRRVAAHFLVNLLEAGDVGDVVADEPRPLVRRHHGPPRNAPSGRRVRVRPLQWSGAARWRCPAAFTRHPARPCRAPRTPARRVAFGGGAADAALG